jgi:hypothetical protein
MPRILYLMPGQGSIQGGNKVIIRHVESLRRLGFDAYCAQGKSSKPPTWIDHSAPFVEPLPAPDDIVVAPDDAADALRALAPTALKTIVLAQNPYYCALLGFEALDLFPPGRPPVFIVVSQGLKQILQRAYPNSDAHIVPCFADERLFQPGAAGALRVAFPPKKRQLEAKIIRELFRKMHPRHADLGWVALERMREPQVAATLAQCGLFLSLSRLESVGMTTLEAMASGCLCAGFTGIGGAEYATPANGIWAPEDDCVAAADALAQAADLLKSGSPEADRMRSAGFEAAAAWSHRRFETALEDVWMRLAPEARTL